MEKVSWRSISTQAKIIGTALSIAGAFVVTLYKTTPMNSALPQTSKSHMFHWANLFNFPVSSWVIDGFLLAATYLLLSVTYIIQGGAEVWCMEIQNNQGQDMTILGDLVLQNKVVVYNLARQQIRWVDYNCSGTVNVTANLTGSNTYINTGQVSDNGSSRIGSPLGVWSVLTLIMALCTSLL